jgi:hypothetical protein
VITAALLADASDPKAGPIGLGVILILVVVTYFLYKSMSRHIKNVPQTFDDAQASKASDRTDGNDSPS